MVLAYSEMFLGEGWCSGVPFSSEDGTTTTLGQPLTTDAMFQLAVAHFDSALSLAETNSRVLNGSKIGKGRALANLGKFPEAAAAVAGVPTNFILTTSHSANSSTNGAWSGTTSGASRYRVMTSEGKNGLPFLGQPTTADARIPWAASTRNGFSSQFTAQPNETKFGQYTDGVVTTGAEARLIEAEAQLQAGTQAARDAVFASLNSLRTGGAPIGGTSTANVTVAAMAGSCADRAERRGRPAVQGARVLDVAHRPSARRSPPAGSHLQARLGSGLPDRHVDVATRRQLRDEHHDHGAVLGAQQLELQGLPRR